MAIPQQFLGRPYGWNDMDMLETGCVCCVCVCVCVCVRERKESESVRKLTHVCLPPSSNYNQSAHANGKEGNMTVCVCGRERESEWVSE